MAVGRRLSLAETRRKENDRASGLAGCLALFRPAVLLHTTLPCHYGEKYWRGLLLVQCILNAYRSQTIRH